jgi:uroporphyrin-III C-methyltransferase/precorrin-2 dehydrogenase/sirohydrochlorin ferrochelatase
MRYFPIYLDLDGAKVVIAGGGEAALQKARLLLKTGAIIVVADAAPGEGLRGLAAAGRLTLIERPFRADDLDGARLAYGASADERQNAVVSAAARARGIPVNVVDTPDQSSFLTPAIVDRAPVTVAIGTEGAGPVLARAIKARIEAMLPTHLGAVAMAAAALRERVGRAVGDGAARRRVWSQVFEAGWRLGARAARERAEALLGPRRPEPAAGAGLVWLVGAGPGDAELMTLKARRVLDTADVVVHDRLVDAGVLELARREARLIPVGKTPGGPHVAQDRINQILVAEARAGHTVVRLKGGDPLVFGRAEEELAALAAAGIETRIVPGITAASAAAAAAGLPLTARDHNRAVALITARAADGPAEHDWRALAAEGAAFAVYMGVGQARFLQGRLLLHGARPQTEVVVVENASLPAERVLVGRLGGLSDLVREAGIAGPAVILVGLARPGGAAAAVGEAVVRTAAGDAA